LFDGTNLIQNDSGLLNYALQKNARSLCQMNRHLNVKEPAALNSGVFFEKGESPGQRIRLWSEIATREYRVAAESKSRLF
jgi:hypothetical protein